jgi:single-strand DNA-binding protein
MSFNKIIIIGNLGRDPELRYTPQGDAVCNFSIAVNEKRKDKAGELQDITTWFKVTLWKRQAENASKYLTKGSPVYIEGRLHVEEWTDRDGNNRWTLEVTGTDMQFIGTRGTENDSFNNSITNSTTDHNFATENTISDVNSDDDIPF